MSAGFWTKPLDGSFDLTQERENRNRKAYGEPVQIPFEGLSRGAISSFCLRWQVIELAFRTSQRILMSYESRLKPIDASLTQDSVLALKGETALSEPLNIEAEANDPLALRIGRSQTQSCPTRNTG